MGIDYSRGITNIDHETGIRYGVISANYINIEDFVFHYSIICPECGTELEEFPDEDDDGLLGCSSCGYNTFNADEFYSDEPSAVTYDEDGYSLAYSLDSNDIWVFKSPFKTMAGFCSPCAPGACYLTDRSEDAWAYCLGPEWFEDAVPYLVTKVD